MPSLSSAPHGIIYLGIADELKEALTDYTEGSRGETGIPQEEAVAIMLEKYEVVSAMFHGFDYSKFIPGMPAERLKVMPSAMEHILSQESGKARLLQSVAELSKAFTLSVPHSDALRIKDDVGFFSGC
jgi:type I restriction enzyme R subunit